MALARLDRAEPARVARAIDRGLAWLRGMQGRDGGWASFDADQTRLLLNNIPFADHGALLDPATEDLTARVFLRALRHLEDYEPRGGGFGAWLFTIAHNLLSNWYRDRGRRRQQPLDSAPELSTASDPPSDFERAEEAEAVRRAVAGLGPERQRLITLKYVEGLSNREIGRMLGKSEGAVKSSLFRTLAALRRSLERDSDAGVA